MERVGSFLGKAKGTIAKYRMLGPNVRVVVGVSGGPDSVSLIHLLRRLEDEYNLTLWIAHLNHKLRGKEGEEEVRWVKQFGRELDIPVISDSCNVSLLAKKKKLSLEEAGRRARYNFLEHTANEVGASRIALAHTASDQVETLLMRLIKGAGLDGLSGIPPVRGRVIRPLIEIFREEVEVYCKDNHLYPCQDSSNLQLRFLRNRIRWDLIPHLSRQYNPGIAKTVLRTSQILREEGDYLERQTRRALRLAALGQNNGKLILDIQKLHRLHPAIQRRVVRKALGEVKGDLKGITFDHISSILGMGSGKGTKKLDLPTDLVVQREYDRLVIKRRKNKELSFHYPLIVPGKREIPESRFSLEAEIILDRPTNFAKEDSIGYLDWDRLEEPLFLRQRKRGDRFQPSGMIGTKKIKDFFIDLKIPSEQRDMIPLLISKDKIAWVVGYRVDERFKIRQDTLRVLRVKVRKNEGQPIGKGRKKNQGNRC
jgi:tRNA(Ile)-lysidine synthase